MFEVACEPNTPAMSINSGKIQDVMSKFVHQLIMSSFKALLVTLMAASMRHGSTMRYRLISQHLPKLQLCLVVAEQTAQPAEPDGGITGFGMVLRGY